MPIDWLYIWEGDFDNLATVFAERIRTVVTRYRGKAALWHCAARMNAGEILSLSEEQRLRLAVLAVETTRQADPRVPVVLWIDQPWGEFMGSKPCDLSPLHFADALVRADLGLAGLGLEINLGYYPGGTQPRDMLDVSRMIDRWSCLGHCSLLVTLTIPAATRPPIPQAALHSSRVLPLAPNGQVSAGQPIGLGRASCCRCCCPNSPVQGVVWNQLLDSQPHELAHGGLFDHEGHGKPALQSPCKVGTAAVPGLTAHSSFALTDCGRSTSGTCRRSVGGRQRTVARLPESASPGATR